MKKVILVMLVISLSICFSACAGRGGEIDYTGDYQEYNSSSADNMSNSADSSTSSTTAPSESSTAETVLVPLTTVPGGTVPTVLTTEHTSEMGTMDYTPIDIPVTKPPVATVYANPTTAATNPVPNTGNNYNTTTTTKPASTTTTEKKTTYVSVSSGDTSLDVDTESCLLTLYVYAEDFGIKMKKTSGDATVTINGEKQTKASFTVSENVGDDGWITVTVKPKSAIVFVSGDSVTVTMPKGALLSTKNVSNQKFTSISAPIY